MIFNKYFDIAFIKFPIYLPIIYFIILYQLPHLEYALVFFTLFLLAEPHFGATWPIFLNKINHSKILSEKFYFIYLPIIILIIATFSYFYLNYIFLIVFFAVNLFHVTRQSFGISKLYLKDINEINFQKYFIYIFGFLFFLIGIIRFYLNFNSFEFLLVLNSTILIVIFLLMFFYVIKFKFTENLLLFFTGIIIFFPICFVETPIHGIIMGVTMHYMQYLAMTYKVELNRKVENTNKNFIINSNFIIMIVIYGLIMACLSFANKFELNYFQYLLIVPILGQLLHFYLDAFLWRFSEKHNREITLKYLKS